MRMLLLTLGLLCMTPGSARADCDEGIAELIARLANVTDPKMRELLERDLRQAQFELWEFDEAECATVLAHAASLLKGATS